MSKLNRGEPKPVGGKLLVYATCSLVEPINSSDLDHHLSSARNPQCQF